MQTPRPPAPRRAELQRHLCATIWVIVLLGAISSVSSAAVGTATSTTEDYFALDDDGDSDAGSSGGLKGRRGGVGGDYAGNVDEDDEDKDAKNEKVRRSYNTGVGNVYSKFMITLVGKRFGQVQGGQELQRRRKGPFGRRK